MVDPKFASNPLRVGPEQLLLNTRISIQCFIYWNFPSLRLNISSLSYLVCYAAMSSATIAMDVPNSTVSIKLLPPQATKSNAPLGFFDLPRELRDHILYFTDLVPDPAKYHADGLQVGFNHRGLYALKWKIPTSIFRVSRQMYEEATEFFYSRNRLIILGTSLQKFWFLQKLKPEYLHHTGIRRIELRFSGEELDGWRYGQVCGGHRERQWDD